LLGALAAKNSAIRDADNTFPGALVIETTSAASR
jgi:hypothetical protein